MDSTLLAAAIGVGGTVIVGLAGFGTTIWSTRKTIAHDRDNRLWDKRAAAYEAALTEVVNRSATRQRWLNSCSETWTAENLAEYIASQDKPEWSEAEGRLLAYSPQRVLRALYVARSADADVSQAFDRVGVRLTAGKSEIAAGTLTFDELRDQVRPMLDMVREAVNESLNRNNELVALMQIELQGRARGRPTALEPENNLLPD